MLVSAGFDAAEGHSAPLGGYKVTPACFGWMTKQLMSLGSGKVSFIDDFLGLFGFKMKNLCTSQMSSRLKCTTTLLHRDPSQTIPI